MSNDNDAIEVAHGYFMVGRDIWLYWPIKPIESQENKWISPPWAVEDRISPGLRSMLLTKGEVEPRCEWQQKGEPFILSSANHTNLTPQITGNLLFQQSSNPFQIFIRPPKGKS